MAPNKLKRPGRCDEEDAIEAGVEAASEMVSKMPNGQRAWGEKERAIAERAARTAVADLWARMTED